MTVVIDHKITLENWAIITIREWIRKIRELGITNSGALIASFEANVVTNAGGDLEKVVFAFEYYGKMVDWGVGKSVNIETRRALESAGLTKRKKQEWFKQFYHELNVLKNLYAEKYAIQFTQQIVSSLEG